MIRVHPWWSAMAILMNLGCGGTNPEANPTPESMEISPAGPLIVRAGDVVPLGITVRDRTGQGLFIHEPIEFTSTHPEVANAGEPSLGSYILTAVAPGKAVIIAKTEGVGAQIDVTVAAWPRGEVSGGAYGAAAQGSVVMVTTLDGHVDRVDPVTGNVLAEYDFSSPYVALSADASRAFFGNTVLDVASGTPTGSLLADTDQCGSIFAARERPQGSIIYVGCGSGVVVASSTTGATVGTIPTAMPVNALALDPTGQRLYASAPSAGRVYEISTGTSTLLRELPILGGPQATALPGGDDLYETMEGEHQIERWDLSGPTATDSVAVQPVLGLSGPFDLALNGAGTQLLASAGPFVLQVDRATLTVSKTYWVGGIARRIAVSGGSALVANEGGWVDVLPFP